MGFDKSSKNYSKKNLAMLGFAKTLCIFAPDKNVKNWSLMTR